MYKMWSLVFFTIFTILRSVQPFVMDPPADEVINNYNYKLARALLTPEQKEFLTELLAADDAIIEATSRGIVDDILQTLSGTGNGVRVNIIGGSPQQQQQTAQAVQALNPSVSISGQLLGGAPARDLINPSSTGTGTTQTGSVSGVVPASGATGAVPSQSTAAIGGQNNHLFSTISTVISNSNRRNVTGIVDESLRIATPAPIREFVTGILNVVYCNSIRRLLGRC